MRPTPTRLPSSASTSSFSRSSRASAPAPSAAHCRAGVVLLSVVLALFFLPSASVAAPPGTVPVIDYEEDSYYKFVDPMTNPSAWTCSPSVPAGRCKANFSSGDVYIINGLVAVDPKLPNNRIYYYVHLYAKSLNPAIGGPAYHYEDAAFVVMSAPRTWNGMRGSDLVLERDDIRTPDGADCTANPETCREWTMAHAIYDATPGKFFVTAATPRNGNNNAYVDGYINVGLSSDGINGFDWRNVFEFERTNDYRLLGLFFDKDPDYSCVGQSCQYLGVLTWLKHSNGFFGTTPIRYRPCFGASCTNQGQIDIRIENQGWKTYTLPSSNAGVNLGTLGVAPERTVIGRTTGYTKATYGGVTQYELWRDLKSATTSPGAWAPCSTSNPTYASNRQVWPQNKGAKLQYRRYDPVSASAVDSNWIDFTSPLRDIAPAEYNMFTTWIVGRIDYGGENMLYLANRDTHICVDANDWDLGTGKAIWWIKLDETTGLNQ